MQQLEMQDLFSNMLIRHFRNFCYTQPRYLELGYPETLMHFLSPRPTRH